MSISAQQTTATVITAGVLLCLSACAPPKNSGAETIDAIEEKQLSTGDATTLNQMAMVMNQAGDEVRISCLKSFAHSRFCACLSSQMPLAGDFATYINATAFTKEQMGYQGMTIDERALVDQSRQARERCVSKLKF